MLSTQESQSNPWPDTFEKYRDTPPISMAYFCKSMPSSWQKVVYTPPICITIRLHLYRDTFSEVLGSGGLKKAFHPWIKGKHGAQTMN